MHQHNNDRPDDYITLGKAVIQVESQALLALIDRIDKLFSQACRIILACQGRVVVTGMGKSGHIGKKIAATLASTGTPAFFVHPGEAGHGDLGMITKADVVIALSNSGSTEEIVRLLPIIKRLEIPLLTLTGSPNSTLAKNATVNLDVSVEKEACPLGLAPTASTSAALAMGDALAIALLQARGFSKDDFALSHPGGRLGRRLLIHVADIMRTGDEIPAVKEAALLREALVEMSRKSFGTTAIVDDDFIALGILTDGDVRRALDANVDFGCTQISEVMSRDYKAVSADLLAASALAMMERLKINALLVIDDSKRLIGILNMHDLLAAKII